jgi:glyoxylase-like metal-dependent hydrolase (beta-lactamase superfamily II)
VPPLEDHTGDIVGKAQRGLGFTNDALAQRARITVAQLRTIKAGEGDDAALRSVAGVLGLGADALVALRHGRWSPRPVPPIDGFRMFTTPYAEGGLTVNAYLLWEPATRKAVTFDSGADARPMIEAARELGLTVELILITHAHVDHVMDVQRLQDATGAKVWINAREGDEEEFPRGAETFATGQSFVLGQIRIETRLTSGQSAGQTTYVIRGLRPPVAVIGDSLFAGSMGGGLVSYADQLRNNREQIMTLSDDTVLASGHGPLTTVGEEKAHNPFFTVEASRIG